MAWPVRTDSTLVALPPGSRLGPRWRPAAWQGRTAVGIDLGGGSLKLVQVSWGRRGVRLETFAWVPLPWGTVEEGTVVHPSQVASILRAVYQALGIRQRRAVACVGGPGVLMRPVSFPPIPAGELSAAIRFEAPQYLPIPEEQLIYDFAPLPHLQEGTDGQLLVLLAGTHRKLADSYIATCEIAGVRLQALDVDCLCALRALEAVGLARVAPSEALVLLDGGEGGLALTIFHCGVPVLTRTLASGIADLRVAVAEGLEIGVAEAQARIWSEGLDPEGAVGTLGGPWIRGIAEAVGRSLEFFLIQQRDVTASRIYLSGAWATLPHLERVLRSLLLEITGTRLQSAEPLRVTAPDLGAFPGAEGDAAAMGAGPAVLAALGAALRGVSTQS